MCEVNVKSEIYKLISKWLDDHEFVVSNMRFYEIDNAIKSLTEDIMNYVE